MVNTPAQAVPAQADFWKTLDNTLTVCAASLPQYTLPPKAYGGTGYLDGLEPSDLPVGQVGGVDRHGRPFIAVSVTYYGEPSVVVFFKRYVAKSDFKEDPAYHHIIDTNGSVLWVSAGERCGSVDSFLEVCDVLEGRDPELKLAVQS